MLVIHITNKYQANGWKRLPGYAEVGKYKNGSKLYLPRIRKNYRKYDAAAYSKGKKGKERYVVHQGRFDKKRIYYSSTNYNSWKRIK